MSIKSKLLTDADEFADIAADIASEPGFAELVRMVVDESQRKEFKPGSEAYSSLVDMFVTAFEARADFLATNCSNEYEPLEAIDYQKSITIVGESIKSLRVA